MAKKSSLGGVVHTYQKYNPVEFPSPHLPQPDLLSSAFEMALAYGDFRSLSEEELARAVRLDPSQIAGLGPSIDHLRRLLEEHKQRILRRYEVDGVLKQAKRSFQKAAQKGNPPPALQNAYRKAVQGEQIYELENLWYRLRDDSHPFAKQLVHIMQSLGEKYQVEELASKYTFSGSERLDVDQAIQVKRVLEKIDELLKQLDEAEKTAQIALIDMEALAEFAPPTDLASLEEIRTQVENYVRELAERQGLDRDQKGNYRMTPKAMRVVQSRLLERIFGDLVASKSGRHAGRITGDGSVELPSTKPFEFGDSIANIDIVQSVTNLLLRDSERSSLRLRSEDIEVHRTLHSPKCATVVIMDMSGSMRYDGQYMNVKRMALALQGLIQSQYPGDFLRFIEMYTFAKIRAPARSWT